METLLCPEWISSEDFHPVVKLPGSFYVHDFSEGEDLNPTDIPYSVGRYNEERKNMYTSPQYLDENRNIHMGIDIAAPIGSLVYSFYDSEIYKFKNNNQEGNYGPTIVTRSVINGHELFALYGHLNLGSIESLKEGQAFKKGAPIGQIGEKSVNGGWFPHLHFQLSLVAPDSADMPGVVAKSDREKALQIYPDPRWVLGPLYT